MKHTNSLESVLHAAGLLRSGTGRDVELLGLSNDSRTVTPGDLFICKGYGFKPEYLLKAREAGAVCYMADADVAAAAKLTGVTRASISMEKAAREHPNAVFAVGNAPTALMRLSQLIEDGLRPALVIGVPVGFVNVVEAKELIWDTCEKFGIPAIVAFGRKGGSNVAAAIANALLYSAAGMESPSARA